MCSTLTETSDWTWSLGSPVSILIIEIIILWPRTGVLLFKDSNWFENMKLHKPPWLFIESPAYFDIAGCLKRFLPHTKVDLKWETFSSIEKYPNLQSAVFLWHWHDRQCTFVSDIHLRTVLSPKRAIGSCMLFSCLRGERWGFEYLLFSCRNVQVEWDLQIETMMVKPPLLRAMTPPSPTLKTPAFPAHRPVPALVHQ